MTVFAIDLKIHRKEFSQHLRRTASRSLDSPSPFASEREESLGMTLMVATRMRD